MEKLRKYFFIFETLAGLAILVALNSFLQNEPQGFSNVNPHPYWIVVLLIASRYGTMPGLFAGCVAAFLYLYLASTYGGIDFGLHRFPHGAYKHPFQFLLIGGVIGEIRSLYKRKYQKMEARYSETRQDLLDLGLLHGAVTESKTELEKRIAFQTTTLLNLLERLNAMESLELEALYKKSLQLIEEQLNVLCASIYLIKDNELVLFARQEKEKLSSLSDKYELTYGMMGEVIASKKVVTIDQFYLDEKAEKFNQLDLIMSAPLMRRDGTVLGVINVERIPFFDFTMSTVRIFETISHWISVVADKALQFKQLKDKNIADEVTGAYNYLYFQKRLSYEVARAKRFKIPLSLLLLKVCRFEEMKEHDKNNILVVLNWLFTHLLREIDLVSKYRSDDTFAIIFPHQTGSQAENICLRLVQEVDNYQFKPFPENEELLSLKYGVSSLLLSDGSMESLTTSAEERLCSGGVLSAEDVFSDISYLVTTGE